MSLPFDGFFAKPQLVRWLAALPRRFSCRQYAASADLSQLSALDYAAERVSLPGIRIQVVKEGAEDVIFPLPFFPHFEGHKQYAVILAQKDMSWPLLCAGISGQAFALELSSLGLQGCWITGNYKRAVARLTARDNEQVVAVMPFGQPADPDGARNTKRKILTALSPDDPTLWPYWAYHAAEAVRSAPSSMNRQPVRLSFTGSTLSFAGKKLDSIDTGIALCHLECALSDQPHSWRLASDQKTLLVQTKEQDEPA